MNSKIDGEPIPVAYPSVGAATRLPDGGWVLNLGVEAVRWYPPRCGVREPTSQYECTRQDHRSPWHVAETSAGMAIAVWLDPAPVTPPSEGSQP